MFFGGMFIDYRVEKAVLRCIAERGIDSADPASVAAILGRGRSTLYRQYGDWKALLEYTHGRTLEAIDALFRCPPAERRSEFDAWWARVLRFLREPHGRAFRALRARIDCHVLDEEVCRLPALFEWVGRAAAPLRQGAPSLAQAAWLLLLSASSSEPRSAMEVDFRELVWSMAGKVDASGSDELDFDAAYSLGSPIT